MPRSRTIATRIILLTVLFSSAVTLLFTAIQLYRDFRADSDILYTTIADVRAIHLDSITASLWGLDKSQLSILLDGILRVRDIEFVRIVKDGGTLLARGTEPEHNAIRQDFPIVRAFEGKNLSLGTLHVIASLDGVYARLWDRVGLILLGNGLMTFAVSLFILLLFRQLVARHLDHLAEYANAFDVSRPDTPLTLRRKPGRRDGGDELEQVVNGINKMRTNLREAYGDLHAGRRLLRTVLDTVPQWILVKDLEHRILMVNQAMADDFGVSPEEFVGKLPGELTMVPEETRRLWRETDDRVMQTGEKDRLMEYSVALPDGSERVGTLYKTPLLDEGGNIVGVVGVSNDITERKRAEDALRESETLQRSVLDLLPSWVFVMDTDFRFRLINRKMAEDFGRELGEVADKPDLLSPHMTPGEIAVLEDLNQGVMEKNQPVFNTEVWITMPTGEARLYSTSRMPLRDELGNMLGLVGVAEDITERKRVEEKVRESQRLLQAVFETIPHSLHIKDTESRYLMVNKAHAARFGTTPEDWNGRLTSEIDVLTEELKQTLMKRDRAVLENGESIRIPEYPITLPNGETHYYHMTKEPLRDENGNITGTIGLGVDITERKRAEEALRESEALLRSVLDLLPSWVFMMDTDFRFRLINRKMAEDFGREPGELADKPDLLSPHMTPGEISVLDELNQGVMKTNRAVENAEVWITLPTRETRLYSTSRMPLRDELGNIIGLVGVAEDITERKRAEEGIHHLNEGLERQVAKRTTELEGERNFIATVMDTQEALVVVLDGEGRIVRFNPACERLTQYSFTEVEGRLVWDLLTPAEEKEGVRAVFRNLHAGNFPNQHENDWVAKDGKRPLIAWSNNAIVDEEGKVAFIIGTGIDITERRRGEEALRAQAHVIDHVHGAVTTTDLEGKIVSWNRYAEEMYGYSNEEAIGKPIFMLAPPEGAKEFKNLIPTVLERGSLEIESLRIRKSGEIFPIFLSLSVITSPSGEPLGLAGFSLDITERKTAEAELEEVREELILKEKMATLGQLTATVSHELRNPLGTIRTSAYSIREGIRGLETGQERAVERIERNITRCDNIITDLLDYSRNRKPNPVPTPLDRWLTELIAEQTIPEWLVLEWKLALEDLILPMDQDYIRRAVINLFENAVQALDPEGSNGLRKRKITLSTRIRKKRVEIAVNDNGPGIPEKVFGKIFEPLFSTKNFGVGLGLPTVKQIMDQNGGGIEISSKAGKGTKALLWLPLADKIEGAA